MKVLSHQSIHTLPQYSRELRPPLVRASDRSNKDSPFITIGGEAACHSADISFLSERNFTQENSVVYQSATLRHHPYHKFFFSKLKEIERLENEISRVEVMTVEQYNFYRDENCPLLKTKNQLISNNLYWQRHYQQQILSVLERSDDRKTFKVGA